MATLAMGGYGGFVWSSYALVVFLLVATVVALLVQKRKHKKRAPPADLPGECVAAPLDEDRTR